MTNEKPNYCIFKPCVILTQIAECRCWAFISLNSNRARAQWKPHQRTRRKDPASVQTTAAALRGQQRIPAWTEPGLSQRHRNQRSPGPELSSHRTEPGRTSLPPRHHHRRCDCSEWRGGRMKKSNQSRRVSETQLHSHLYCFRLF